MSIDGSKVTYNT